MGRVFWAYQPSFHLSAHRVLKRSLGYDRHSILEFIGLGVHKQTEDYDIRPVIISIKMYNDGVLVAEPEILSFNPKISPRFNIDAYCFFTAALMGLQGFAPKVNCGFVSRNDFVSRVKKGQELIKYTTQNRGENAFIHFDLDNLNPSDLLKNAINLSGISWKEQRKLFDFANLKTR